MHRILAVHLPTFAVDRVRQSAGGRAAPILLVEETRGTQRIGACCERARAAGARSAMTVAHARALLVECEPVIEPFDPEGDALALAALVPWASRFSPTIAVEGPGGLLFDVTGTRRLFGEEARLAREVAHAFEGRGFGVRVAVAGTIGCAWALARHGPPGVPCVPTGDERRALGPLPVVALRIEAETAAGLGELEIETIQEVLDLPRSGLPARFRGELLERLDQALGRAFEPVLVERVLPPLRASHAFEAPVGLEVVQHTVESLLRTLTKDLDARRLGARRLELELTCAEAEDARASILLSRPSPSYAHLLSLLAPRLERIQLGFGAERVSLAVPDAGPADQQQVSAWGTDQRPSNPRRREGFDAELGRLVDNLVLRLGRQKVLAMECIDTHAPESAHRATPILDAKRRAEGESVPLPPLRPTRLFDTPPRVRVETADGAPARIAWRGGLRDVRAYFGPERVRPPWWKKGKHEARDYYRVLDGDGRWLWLLLTADGRWFAHGEWT
ncbi:MAG: DNA polymerase Y family protein [bacterium]|nr:DNA polymerase Y family protein [bacterium]